MIGPAVGANDMESKMDISAQETYPAVAEPTGLADQALAPTGLSANAGLRRLASVALVFPAAICLMSWLGGGIHVLTNIGFLALTLICAVMLLAEARKFVADLSVGGIIIFGGTLVWYCHDYLGQWWGVNWGMPPVPVTEVTVAKAAFYTCLGVFAMSIGLRIPYGKFAEKWIRVIPEPAENTYLTLIIALCVIGLIPYMFLVQESFFVALLKEMTAMRSGEGATWLVARTGNMNYRWDAYLLHLTEVGQLGGLLASFYAIMIARNMPQKLITWAIWLLWFALAVGSGTRGMVVFFGLPLMLAFFLKGHIAAQERGHRTSLRTYLSTIVIGVVMLALMQFQGTFRQAEISDRNFGQIELLKVQGDHMFSEGLRAYEMVPESVPYTSATFPGAIYVRPIPDLLVRFAIGWIPRALWTSKPGFSEFGAEYNRIVSGGSAENEQGGGTICLSICGGAFVGYGFAGVIQIGLVFGWLAAVTERVLRQSIGHHLRFLFCLGVATWLFRCFRDLTPHDIYPLLIGVAAASLLAMIFGRKRGPAEA